MASIGQVFSDFSIRGLDTAMAGLKAVAEQLDAFAGKTFTVGGGDAGGLSASVKAASDQYDAYVRKVEEGIGQFSMKFEKDWGNAIAANMKLDATAADNRQSLEQKQIEETDLLRRKTEQEYFLYQQSLIKQAGVEMLSAMKQESDEEFQIRMDRVLDETLARKAALTASTGAISYAGTTVPTLEEVAASKEAILTSQRARTAFLEERDALVAKALAEQQAARAAEEDAVATKSAFLSTYSETRSLRGGAMELVLALQMVSLALGEQLPVAAQEAAKGLQMVSMGAMAGFAFGPWGVALGAIAGGLLAIGIALNTVTPEVAALNKELDNLGKKDDPAIALARLSGLTIEQARAALDAAKNNADYAGKLADAAKAAEADAKTLANRTAAERDYDAFIKGGYPAVEARAMVEQMYGKALSDTIFDSQNALIALVNLGDAQITQSAAAKIATAEQNKFATALENITPHDILIDGIMKLAGVTEDQAKSAIEAAKNSHSFADELAGMLGPLTVMKAGVLAGTISVDDYTVAINAARDAVLGLNDAEVVEAANGDLGALKRYSKAGDIRASGQADSWATQKEHIKEQLKDQADAERAADELRKKAFSTAESEAKKQVQIVDNMYKQMSTLAVSFYNDLEKTHGALTKDMREKWADALAKMTVAFAESTGNFNLSQIQLQQAFEALDGTALTTIMNIMDHGGALRDSLMANFLDLATGAGTLQERVNALATALNGVPSTIKTTIDVTLTGLDAKYFTGKPGSRDLTKELEMTGDKEIARWTKEQLDQHIKDLMTEYNVNPEQFVNVPDQFKKDAAAQAATTKSVTGPIDALSKGADDLTKKLTKTTSPALQAAIVNPMQAGIDKTTEVTNLYLDPIKALHVAVDDLVAFIRQQFGALTGANKPSAGGGAPPGGTPPGGSPNTSFSPLSAAGFLSSAYSPVASYGSLSGAYAPDGSGDTFAPVIHVHPSHGMDEQALASAVAAHLAAERSRYHAGRSPRY